MYNTYDTANTLWKNGIPFMPLSSLSEEEILDLFLSFLSQKRKSPSPTKFFISLKTQHAHVCKEI